MTWGYVAVAAGTVVAGAISADSNRSAANKAADATKQANDAQERMYNQTRQDNMPMLDQRNWALGQLRDMLAKPIDGQTVQQQPGYQFGLDQGMTQLQRAMNARGMRNSGSMLQEATKFGQDYAGSKMNDYIAQRNAMASPYQSLAGLGQSGATQIGAAGTNAANAFGQNMMANANMQGAAGIANANVWGNGINQLTGWYANQNRNRGGGMVSSGGAGDGSGWSYLDYQNGG